LCAQGRSFSGRITLGQFPRLTPLLASTDGEAVFTLSFTRDDQGRFVVQGRVEAQLQLVCQRCLGSMQWPVTAEVHLALVAGPDAAAHLPEELDPLWVEQDEVRLSDIVEDELILATPDTPRHQPEACPVDVAQAAEQRQTPAKREHPFAALAALKQGKNQN
jgi:uncharacterized protein